MGEKDSPRGLLKRVCVLSPYLTLVLRDVDSRPTKRGRIFCCLEEEFGKGQTKSLFRHQCP